MANVNQEITRLLPTANPDSAGNKIGFFPVTTKAASGDTITFTNASLIEQIINLKVASITQENINVTDDDSAATNGVALYIHTNNGVDAWFEFVSPTNADGTGTLNNGGSTYFIFDSDTAATDGVALYFDEDATNANERFLIVSPSGQDMFVTLENGKKIKLVHDASAATNGVQVYFDEDGANSYERLLFVSPTNANGTGQTESFEEVGDSETHTISGNIVTLTGDSVGTVKGTIIYK